MADVQVEKGHTRIANELFEALIRTRIPGRHKDVAYAMIRLLYGYNRTEDRIAACQVAELVGVQARRARQMLADLESWQMLERVDAPKGRPARWRFVKNYQRWSVSETGDAVRRRRAMSQLRGLPPPKAATQVSRLGGEPAGTPTVGRPGGEPGKEAGRRASPKTEEKTVPKDTPRSRSRGIGQEAVKEWCDCYTEARGRKFGKVSGQDAKLLKSIAQEVGLELYSELLARFHRICDDAFVTNQGYAPKAFNERWRGLLEARRGNGVARALPRDTSGGLLDEAPVSPEQKRANAKRASAVLDEVSKGRRIPDAPV